MPALREVREISGSAPGSREGAGGEGAAGEVPRALPSLELPARRVASPGLRHNRLYDVEGAGRRAGPHAGGDSDSASSSPKRMDSTGQDATMSVGIVRAVVNNCLELGVPRSALWRAVGELDLENPEGRVPLARAHDIVSALQPFHRGLTTMPAASVRCTDCGPPGFMLLTAPSIECFLDSLRRYYRLVVDVGNWRVSHNSDGVYLVYELSWDIDLVSAWVEAALSTTVSLLRDALVGVRIRRVRFRHAAPRYASSHLRFFGCPIDFGADDDCIVIEHCVMDSSTRMNNEPMYRYFERQLAAQVSSASHSPSFVERVHSAVVARVAAGDASAAAVARQLGMSERTLRRRLEEQGSCFRLLLEQARLKSAERMLRASDSSLTEIAAALGFSEVSAFSRAFRRGAGISPRAFRVSRRN